MKRMGIATEWKYTVSVSLYNGYSRIYITTNNGYILRKVYHSSGMNNFCSGNRIYISFYVQLQILH